ncbi:MULTISPECIES: manganese efflux pump MntP family protein [Coprobacillaceae]|uniref:manganese efflux pump MntP n=1 Tax=Coprobacillaceae TaxID=2810280 RepID=UPI000E51B74A|nr:MULTISPECIES: manganese efflux pump MntP family protein [Coprobacillaceae]RHM59853.1 manganese efflux pump [Coprobacillus sp. AF33-1AC]RHS92180.1 manganese efflux pump [Erysipelatoclostridium sp. AM42-17]
MTILQLFLLGIGLAMDATAVSICKGLKMKKVDYRYMVLIAGAFGIFQAIMPLAGYYLGSTFSSYITSIDHWIAFILLGVIGGKMIFEAFENEEDDSGISYDLKEVLLLAIATSIDALAVGITFSFLQVNIWIAIAIIGMTTFVCSVIGVFVGNRFGIRYKSKAEIVGGIILIAIGVKILVEHLGLF